MVIFHSYVNVPGGKIWWFPKIWVPPNHPSEQDFPLSNIHFGVPTFMETKSPLLPQLDVISTLHLGFLGVGPLECLDNMCPFRRWRVGENLTPFGCGHQVKPCKNKGFACGTHLSSASMCNFSNELLWSDSRCSELKFSPILGTCEAVIGELPTTQTTKKRFQANRLNNHTFKRQIVHKSAQVDRSHTGSMAVATASEWKISLVHQQACSHCQWMKSFEHHYELRKSIVGI